MRDITQPPPAIKVTQQQLECVNCGARTHATCTCGVNYVPVADRVAKYDQEHPGKSTRQAAAELGVNQSSVVRARRDADASPDTVTGRDGKQYPAQREVPDTPVVREHEADRKLALQLIDIGYRALAQKFQFDKAAMAQLTRVTKEMRRHWDVEWF
jgi:hypothetical protein